MKICDVTGMPDDDLERTQRLPVVNGVCNCPIANMIVHVVGCPLRYTFTVNGKPLAELGLDNAIVVHPDGTSHPLIGIYFHRWDDKKSFYENIRLAFAEQYAGCSLVIPL